MSLMSGVDARTGVRGPFVQTDGAQQAIQAWKWVRITGTGAVAGIGPGSIFGGIMTQVAGTSTTITAYDDITTGANNTIIPVTATATTNVAGAVTGCCGSAVSSLTVQPALSSGLVLKTGLYISVGGTGSPAFIVLYR